MIGVKRTQPAWDVFETSQPGLCWERHLKNLLESYQKRCLSCNVFETSGIHLKKDVFYVTWPYDTFQIYLQYFRWRLWDVSKISREYALYKTLRLLKSSPRKMSSCDIRRFTEIFENVFREQLIVKLIISISEPMFA